MTQEPPDSPLQSWKEIAAYLKRDVTTVRRWEKTEGLPVRRHLHESRASVFAYTAELDAWLAGRTPAQQAAESAPRPRTFPRVAALAGALLFAAAASGDGLARPLGTPAAAAQGLTARQLWTGPNVDTTGELAPGGGLLSFVDWDTGDLAIRDLAAGTSRRLTRKGTWAESFEFALSSTFSPDGREIAYAWFTTDMTWELRIAAADGSGTPRVLYKSGALNYLQPSAWSPDGAHVLTLVTRGDNTNQLAMIAAADGSARVLKTLDWRYPLKPVFSPDGRFILFDFAPNVRSAQRDVFLMSADGTRETPLVQHPANDFLPVWAPDGRSVLFLSDRAGNVGLWTLAVGDGRAQDAPRLLKADIGRISMMQIDRHGSLHYALESRMTDVYVASLDIASGLVVDAPAAISQTFVGANRGGDWSPDGRHIAYLSQRMTGPAGLRSSSLVIRTVETGAETMVPLDLTRVSRPRWSRDGRRLLVFAHDTNGGQGMYAIDARTGAASQLFAVAGQAYAPLPVWSADGSAVFYTYPKDKTFLVHRRTLRTGEETIVYRAANAHNLAPSPDGRSLAFTYPSNETNGTESTLVVQPLDGGAPRPIVTIREPDAFALDGVAWTPDGRYLIFVTRHLKGQPHAVWRVAAAGGDPQPLNLPMSGTNVGLRIHPDGRRVLFTSGERSSEIWVLENLPGMRR